jgi:Protein of unknown function (DUF2796)
MKLSTLTVLAAALAASPAMAEDEHRELGPHEHGHGTLNIAVEKARISMELEVPGMDIVGFEHAAESKDDKAAVDKATKALGEPLKLFKVPEAAGCKVAEAKVNIEAEHEHEHEDGDKDHDAKEGEKGGEPANEEHGDHDHEGHEGHNEFHVTYALDCTKPAALTSIAFDYFKSFAGAQKLSVNVVTEKAQNKYEVSRDKPSLDLGGIM